MKFNFYIPFFCIRLVKSFIESRISGESERGRRARARFLLLDCARPRTYLFRTSLSLCVLELPTNIYKSRPQDASGWKSISRDLSSLYSHSPSHFFIFHFNFASDRLVWCVCASVYQKIQIAHPQQRASSATNSTYIYTHVFLASIKKKRIFFPV